MLAMFLKILITIVMFVLGIELSHFFGWWILYFIGIIAEIMVENVK